MKKTFFLLFSWSFLAHAQINLVPNSSFEVYFNCPNSYGQLLQTGNWYSPQSGTPDYYNACCTFPTVGVPISDFGSKYPSGPGNAYAGIIPGFSNVGTNQNDYREYIQTQLTSTLVKGQTYCLSFNVSLADSSRFTTDDIGAYVSAYPISILGQVDFSLNVTPQVANPTGTLLTETTTWTEIKGTFVAGGNEQYITIGHFRSAANTNMVRRLPMVNPNKDFPYYFIDEVSLKQCSTLSNASVYETDEVPGLCYYDASSNKIIIKRTPGTYSVKIFDTYGTLVKTTKLDNVSELDVSDLKNGSYLIVADDSVNRVIKKFFVLN